jgi:ribosomal protein L7/L12
MSEEGTTTTPAIVLTGDSKKIFDLVKNLSALDLSQLVKALEEEFGVSAAAAVVS